MKLRSINHLKNKIQRIIRRGEFIAAISPEGNCYHDFTTIPTIKPPKFLILRNRVIIADGWLIRIAPTRSFLDLISMQTEAWNVDGAEGRQQLQGFMDALERVVLAEAASAPMQQRIA